MDTKDKKLPQSYKNLWFPPTDAYENLLYLYPLTSGSIVVGQQAVKVQWELPNLLCINLTDIWLECNYTPLFTSTNGGDTFSIVQPSFVPFRGPSSIERVTLTCGSNTCFDYYGNNLANNLMMNLQNNIITRNMYQFMGESGQPQTSTSGQPMFTRFKIRYFPKDHLNENGVLPLGNLPKVILSLYFTPGSFCMYYAGTPAGTVSLSYQLDNLQLQVRECASPSLMSALKSNSLQWCSREWYYQNLTLTTAVTQSIQVPCSFKYVRGVVFVLRRQQDIQNIGPTGINKMVEYSPDVSNIVKLNIKLNGVRRQLQDFQNNFEWLYELWRLFPESQYSDYFLRSKIGPEGAVPSYTNTRTIYGLLAGRSYDTETESGIDAGGISSAISIEITWTNALTSTNILECFIIHDRWINIQPNGSSLLIE